MVYGGAHIVLITSVDQNFIRRHTTGHHYFRDCNQYQPRKLNDLKSTWAPNKIKIERCVCNVNEAENPVLDSLAWNKILQIGCKRASSHNKCTFIHTHTSTMDVRCGGKWGQRRQRGFLHLFRIVGVVVCIYYYVFGRRKHTHAHTTFCCLAALPFLRSFGSVILAPYMQTCMRKRILLEFNLFCNVHVCDAWCMHINKAQRHLSVRTADFMFVSSVPFHRIIFRTLCVHCLRVQIEFSIHFNAVQCCFIAPNYYYGCCCYLLFFFYLSLLIFVSTSLFFFAFCQLHTVEY